ncbi:MAG: hypothetical protein O0X49_02955 [Methanocorpusculum sp.]|nr:hypothetical protein [Methanocorpusculum sp.]
MLEEEIVWDETYLSTGVPGLDELLYGGYMKNTVTSIIGESGMGRTTAALQFLVEGIKNGEDVLYISFTHGIHRTQKKLIRMYPWIESELNKKFHFLKLDPKNFDSLSYYLGNGLPELLKNMNVSRLVIDSMTIYEDSMISESGHNAVMAIYHIYFSLKSIPCTTIVVLSSNITDPLQSTNGYSEKFADNVIFLVREFPKDTLLGEYRKICLVLKSRYSRHERYGKLLEFDDNGIPYLKPPT